AVGVNAPVYLHFTEPVNLLTVSAGATGSVHLLAGGNDIAPASISIVSPQDVILTPYGTFPDATPITVSVTSGVEDVSENQLIPFTSTFTTRAGPALTAATAIFAR